MPYIDLKVTRKLTSDQKNALHEGLGKALGTVPGKAPEFLILCIEDGKTFFMGGREMDDYAFATADYVGHFGYDDKRRFSLAVFAAIRDVLGLPDDRMSFIITERNAWANFGDYIESDDTGMPLPRG